MASCTLTDDSFEPSPVDRVGGELNPEAAGDGSPSSDEAVASASDPGDEDGESGGGGGAVDGRGSDGSEPNLGDVPLDPSDTGGGAGPNGDAGGDAGVGPDMGNENPDVDTAPEPPVAASCSGGEFGGSCYQLFGELAAWNIAEQRCLDWGGHLASVQSPEEDVFLDDWAAQLALPFADGSGLWLGGTDAVVDGDFRWMDASPLNFAGWAPNQPDNGLGIDCVEKRNDGAALWYDRRCSDALRFVCERPL